MLFIIALINNKIVVDQAYSTVVCLSVSILKVVKHVPKIMKNTLKVHNPRVIRDC